MFHRPLATVLSSVSIRSLLPSRLFCAPATAIDDAITTVRTTGIRSIRDGSNHSEYGVYWGKDDPRNMLGERNFGRINFSGTELRPIMMALEQAKREGLKKIRVQTDSEINEAIVRSEAQTFNSIDISSMKHGQFPKYAYCERIVKIMNEMEVILEHRPPMLDTENEVIALLNEDTNKPNADRDINYSTHPDYGTIWIGSPKAESSLEGRTVPTEFVEWITVKTTAKTSRRKTIIHHTNVVYWGEGHPWNTKLNSGYGATDGQGSKMLSILMALEQAKNGGLKRIRLQSDLDLDEFSIRRAANVFKNIDLTPISELELSKFAYCDRIVKIMDEIEVILDYKDQWYEWKNEVFGHVKEDINIQNRSRLSHLDLVSEFIITPKDVSPLEGRIVPTVYNTGDVDLANNIGVSASLWVPDSIEHLDINQRPVDSTQKLPMNIVTHFRAQLKAIHSVIEEAQKINLPEIQVVTNCVDFVHFFKLGWKKPDGRTMPNEKLYLDIKALTETSKVHFKGVRLTKDCKDDLLRNVHKMANEGLSTLIASSSLDVVSLDNSLLKPDFPVAVTESIVRTTGFRTTKEGNRHTVLGVYWGEGHPRNTMTRSNLDEAGADDVRIRALVVALQQAKKDRLLKVRVQTDSEMNEFEIRAAAQEFKNLDPTLKSDRRYSNLRCCEKIASIMDEIEVILENRDHPSLWDENDKNEVIMLVINDLKKHQPDWSFFSPDSKSDWTITPKDASPLEGRIVPTVSVAGGIDDEYNSGVIACVWADHSIGHLKIHERPQGSPVRPLPNSGDRVSRFQAQLIAIRSAILEARACNFPEILVVTDSIHFINFFENGWKRSDGSIMPNEKLYLEIKALTETTKVHFKGVRGPEDRGGNLLKKVHIMAIEGLKALHQPTPAKSYFDGSENDLKRMDATPASVTESIVRTTGFRSTKGGNRHRFIGIYWGEGDPRNVYDSSSRDLADTHSLQLLALKNALTKANSDRLPRVRVQTDVKMDRNRIRNAAQRYGNLNPEQQNDEKNTKWRYCARIAKLMDEMEVILEYRSHWVADSNEVASLLAAERKKRISPDDLFVDSKSDWTITPKDASPLDGRIVPTVHVSGKLDNDYTNEVITCVWEPKSIEHLETNRRPPGCSELALRGDIPVTLLRSKMVAIRNALVEAQSFNISEVLVITDSIHFMHFFTKDWIRPNGRIMVNKKLYLEIKALTETIKVHFKLRDSKDCNDKLMKESD